MDDSAYARARFLIRCVALTLLVVACARYEPYDIPQTEERTACSDRNPLRQLYWGDLHVHTALSFDAFSSQLRAGPVDAYAFARGEPIALPPYHTDDSRTRRIQLDRPLDFAAVTDHAEYFGEVTTCVDPDSEGYNNSACQNLRSADGATFNFGVQLSNPNPERFAWCRGLDGDCGQRALSAWRLVQEAAEAAYDRTDACRFTSFIGYEYSSAVEVSNLHRNVIFRSAHVPERPTSFFEAPTAAELYRQVDTDCSAITGCDVLMIPHNANLSNGRMFAPVFSGAEASAENLRLRQRMEPLMEVYQHKGASECMNGFESAFGATDEWCDFELVHEPEFEDCRDGIGGFGMLAQGCVSQTDFARGALLEGLRRHQQQGVNPLKLGLIASTDTHNASPGAVSEQTFAGHKGTDDDDAVERMSGDDITAGTWRDSPGGLVAVWAQENARDALFEALKRREVYGTSGPRIALRFFGGFGLDASLCGDDELVTKGYEQGVPMGSDLAQPGLFSARPTFVVHALQDPGSDQVPGAPLERIQIIKGWVDEAGVKQRTVHTISQGSGDFVTDPSTCQASGAGSSSLCGTWTDDNFRDDQHAFYYVRVLAQPTCRWTSHLCQQLSPDTVSATCSREDIPKLIQERAWSSPIWYTPNSP